VERVTGWRYSDADLRRTGERISTLKKLFNIREGWQPADDWLPMRLLSEPIRDGVAQGVELSADELREMIESYYRARDWNENGFIPESKLRDLGLI
jgi:aldehyde:ferredoxin oxidoreductase